jgi:septal ring factor EnvC (AmiA/AmiB activator)
MVLQPTDENINPDPAKRRAELERLRQLHESLRDKVSLRTAELIRMRRKTEKAKRDALAREAKQKNREEREGRDGGGDGSSARGGLGFVK